MTGFCDECKMYKYKLYKVKDMELCKDCTRDYYEISDEECYDIDEGKEEDYDEE